jgi:hypothetical protein
LRKLESDSTNITRKELKDVNANGIANNLSAVDVFIVQMAMRCQINSGNSGAMMMTWVMRKKNGTMSVLLSRESLPAAMESLCDCADVNQVLKMITLSLFFFLFL